MFFCTSGYLKILLAVGVVMSLTALDLNLTDVHIIAINYLLNCTHQLAEK